MIEILFHHPDEFVEELGKSPSPDDAIVRLTCMHRSRAVNLTHLCVVSTFVRRGQVVRLDYFAGELWPEELTEQNKRTNDRAAVVEDKIRAAAKALVLEVRAGLFRHVGPNGSIP